MRVISQYIASSKNAGPKAKVDIERILKDNYNAKIYTNKVKKTSEGKLVFKIKKAIFNLFALNSKDISVIQIPYTDKLNVLSMAKNKIGIIHDIDGLRFNDEKILKKEINALNTYKVIIVHNIAMKTQLMKLGVKIPMIELELFDYLTDKSAKSMGKNKTGNKKIVVYPGNLEPRKAEFLYSLEEDRMKFDLFAYGPCFEQTKNKRIFHKGIFSPDELPYKMEGTLGLVWSGKIDSSDENESEKGYNKFNTPHKLSCFLVSGIPVIVWDKSAIANLVEEYNIGYKISNLYEINNLDLSEYEQKKKNVEELSEKLTTGYFTRKAINHAINIINEQIKL